MLMLTQEQLDALLAGVTDSDANDAEGVTGRVLSPACLEIAINVRTIGIEQASTVFTAISNLSANAEQHLILNMKECPFLSSFVVGKLVNMVVERKKRGFRLAVVEANEVILEVINLAGMSGMIEMYPSTEEALKNLDG